MASQDEVRLIIKAATEQAVSNINNLNKSLGKTEVQGGKLSRGLTNLKSGWMGATVAVVATGVAFKKIIDVSREFEKSIANVSAVSGLARDQLGKLAREAGKTTVFSAKEAADALYFMASAGLKTSSDFKNVLTPTLNFAAAAQMGIAESTDIVINNLKIYGKEMNEAGKFTDIMTKTIQSSNTDMTQLAGALSYSASTANMAGFSFEELNAVLGAMADQGVKGERAGTQLRMALANLMNVTPEATARLAKYGITVEEISELMPTPIKLFKRLHDANLSQADALKIVGVRQMDVFKLIKDGIPNLERLNQEMVNVSGTAEGMARKQLTTLDGALRLLNSAWQEAILATTSGSPSVADGFKAVVQAITAAINAFNKANPIIQSTVGVVGVAGIAIAVLTKIVIAFGVSLSAAIWPVTLIVAAIVGAIAIIKNWERVVWALKVAWEAVKFSFEIVVQSIKVGMAAIAIVTSKAAEVIATPFINAINKVIEGLNLLPGVNIEAMENIYTTQVEHNEAMLELELQRLADLEMADVEFKARKEENEQNHQKNLNEITDKSAKTGNAILSKNLTDKLLLEKAHAIGIVINDANKLSQLITLEKTYAKEIENTNLTTILALKKIKDQQSKDDKIRQDEAIKDKLTKEIEYKKKASQIDTELLNLKLQNRGIDTQSASSTFNFMMGALDQSSKKQFKIWKAMSIANAAVATYQAAINAYNALAGIPIVGPGLGVAAGIAATAFGLLKVNQIKNTQFQGAEEGALIRGTGAAGTLVRAGENNKDEAIIPLEDSGVMGRMGNQVTINIDTAVMDEEFPQDLAIKIDNALYSLQQSGLSKSA